MNSLKFIALSGTTGVTENLYVYEYGGDMLVVDCGVGFPDQDMLGVDLVIPDFTYIKQNSKKLRGILISHGHEDHLGALPFLLREVNVPIYATKLVAGFIEDKLAEYRFQKAKINVFNPERDSLSLGNFRVTPFRVSHSVPDSVGFCLDTPEGRVFHVSDYKFDWTPVDNRPFAVGKLSALAAEGALALASDCLGSTTPGYTESEKEIEARIEEIVRRSRGQVFFSTISSNISRMKQALSVALKLGRKAVFIGRSIEKKAEIARNLGYLSYPPQLVIPPKQAKKLKNEQKMYIISGSYGQPGSALYRLALGEHEFLTIKENDTVIFSADPAPPGSKNNVDFVVDKLIEANCDVHYYDLQEDLHVSGHGSQKDIEMLLALVKPKYSIPIGGTIRHMHAYSQIAQNLGAAKETVFELGAGNIVEFSAGKGRVSGKIPVREVLVDGLGIGDVGNVVLRDRKALAKEGIVIVIFQVDKAKADLAANPELISRGFVYEGKNRKLLDQAAILLGKTIRAKKIITDSEVIRNTTSDFLERYFFDQTGRRPMILPVILEV
jgi:ribonuclease J